MNRTRSQDGPAQTGEASYMWIVTGDETHLKTENEG